MKNNVLNFDHNGVTYEISENNGYIFIEFEGNCFSISDDRAAQLIMQELNAVNYMQKE